MRPRLKSRNAAFTESSEKLSLKSEGVERRNSERELFIGMKDSARFLDFILVLATSLEPKTFSDWKFSQNLI